MSDKLLAHLVSRIDGLGVNPRPFGCKKLRDYKDRWRIRVGDYRVVYIIDPEFWIGLYDDMSWL